MSLIAKLLPKSLFRLVFFLKISLKIGGKDTPNPADSKVSWTFHDDPTITVKVDRPPTGLFINPKSNCLF